MIKAPYLILIKFLQCFLKQDRICYVTLRYVTLRYVMLCYVMLCYILTLFPGQLRSLVKVAWDSPAHSANPRIHQCLLLELIHYFAVVMTNKT